MGDQKRKETKVMVMGNSCGKSLFWSFCDWDSYMPLFYHIMPQTLAKNWFCAFLSS